MNSDDFSVGALLANIALSGLTPVHLMQRCSVGYRQRNIFQFRIALVEFAGSIIHSVKCSRSQKVDIFQTEIDRGECSSDNRESHNRNQGMTCSANKIRIQNARSMESIAPFDILALYKSEWVNKGWIAIAEMTLPQSGLVFLCRWRFGF